MVREIGADPLAGAVAGVVAGTYPVFCGRCVARALGARAAGLSSGSVTVMTVIGDDPESAAARPNFIAGAPASAAPTSGPAPTKASLKFGMRTAPSKPGVPEASA